LRGSFFILFYSKEHHKAFTQTAVHTQTPSINVSNTNVHLSSSYINYKNRNLEYNISVHQLTYLFIQNKQTKSM